MYYREVSQAEYDSSLKNKNQLTITDGHHVFWYSLDNFAWSSIENEAIIHNSSSDVTYWLRAENQQAVGDYIDKVIDETCESEDNDEWYTSYFLP